MDILIDLETVSDGREYPLETSVKVTSRSDISNLVKTPPILFLDMDILEMVAYGWEYQSDLL